MSGRIVFAWNPGNSPCWLHFVGVCHVRKLTLRKQCRLLWKSHLMNSLSTSRVKLLNFQHMRFVFFTGWGFFPNPQYSDPCKAWLFWGPYHTPAIQNWFIHPLNHWSGSGHRWSFGKGLELLGKVPKPRRCAGGGFEGEGKKDVGFWVGGGGGGGLGGWEVGLEFFLCFFFSWIFRWIVFLVFLGR